MVIQKYFRGSRQRQLFVRKRKAAIYIQAWIRGMFARELVAAIKEQKRKEREEMERKRRLELQRQQEERERVEREESMKAAQKELLTLAKLADYKSRNTTTTAGEVDLDKMFLFLKEDTKPKTAADSKFFSSLTSEMDQLFSTVAIEEAKVKPTRKAPPVPIDPAGKLSRTQRRQRRVQKKLIGMDEEPVRPEERFDPRAFPLIKFAEMYFNDFPKDTSGFSTLSLRRAPKVRVSTKLEDTVHRVVVVFTNL